MNFEIKIAGLATVPRANIDALTRVHTGLTYQLGVLEGVAEISEEYLSQDIDFALKNKIPAENTASRLETYKPNNASQELLLNAAQFIAETRGRFMGLVALGNAGVGKSHVAFGLAKALEIDGQQSRYIHVPSSSSFNLRDGDPKPDETIIIDDLNAAFGWGRDNFAKIITAMHHNGSGRLFITSNVQADRFTEFVKNMIGGVRPDDPEIMRIADRAGTALKTIAVTGDSYRTTSWEDPWTNFHNNGALRKIES